MFKQIVPTSLSVPLLKAGEKKLISYILANESQEIFSFFTIVISFKQPTPPRPVFVKVVEIIQNNQIFQCFVPWSPLIFQPCCATDLRETSLVSLK